MAPLIQITDSGAGIKLPIVKQQITIGCDEDCDRSLNDDLVSKCYAVLEVALTPDGKCIDLRRFKDGDHAQRH